ncbi:MAG: hypothetical protein QM758_01180 [Armatimonas sp.]
MQRQIFSIGAVLAATSAWAQGALPVKEVTVFKDGHAFVLAEGRLPVKDGVAVLDELPMPVLGTFWPYASGGASLVSVTAGLKTVPGERNAASLAELLAQNIGKSLTIKEHDGEAYQATLLSITANLILLQTEKGAKAIDLGRIREVTFPDGFKKTVDEATQKPRLSLRLTNTSGDTANVGVMYLQKGLRWIPGYKIDLDGAGNARVKMQATLINELTDLKNTNMNLVVGVPSFAFKDTTDPIAIQQAIAPLSPYFRADARTSNALAMGQMARMSERAAYAPADEGPGGANIPEVTGADDNEDLFVFSLKNVTLAKGERMVLPITEFTIPYKNVYTLELRPSPTRNAAGDYDTSSLNAELMRLAAAPKAQHQIRLTNTSAYPLTTGPALILRNGNVVAQGLSTFTSKGGWSDISLTDAPDISVKRTDKETGRTPAERKSDGYDYQKVSMAGHIELCNFRKEPVEIEVVRYVLGKIETTKLDGVISALDPLADDNVPGWLGSYGGFDRIRFTGLGKIAWKTTLPPGGKTCVNLDYTWHYFTR